MFRRFMMGRYGNDPFNLFLLAISLVFGVLSMCFGGNVSAVFAALQLLVLIYIACRALSRNFEGRRKENSAFMRALYKAKQAFKPVSAFFARLKDRDHRYFKCPSCKSRLRVPRGRGKITVSCPKCNTKFDRKS